MLSSSFLLHLKYRIAKNQKNLPNNKLYQKEISNNSMLAQENESLKQNLKISKLLFITNNHKNIITGDGFDLRYFYSDS